jgi:HAD superfamily hydrolase (TIGR01549 family)
MLESGDQDIDGIKERLISNHSSSFTSCLRMRSSSRYILDILRNSTGPDGEPVTVGLISNAMDGRAIREFLEREGLGDYFKTIVISAEVNMTKPHTEIFEMALDAVNIDAGSTVYVGDRYFTDVVGSKNAGMKAVYIREYHTAGEPPEGIQIDAPVIENILDLPRILTDSSFAEING